MDYKQKYLNYKLKYKTLQNLTYNMKRLNKQLSKRNINLKSVQKTVYTINNNSIFKKHLRGGDGKIGIFAGITAFLIGIIIWFMKFFYYDEKNSVTKLEKEITKLEKSILLAKQEAEQAKLNNPPIEDSNHCNINCHTHPNPEEVARDKQFELLESNENVRKIDGQQP